MAGATGIVNVSGSSTVWTNSKITSIAASAGTFLTISNSAEVRIPNGLFTSTTSSNIVINILDGGRLIGGNGASQVDSRNGSLIVVSGSGSMWTQAVSAVTIGNSTHNNRLVISNGGLFRIGSTLSVGSNSGTNNTVLVSGAGSTLSNGNYFMTSAGGNNLLTVSNGGFWNSSIILMSTGLGDNSNRVTVTGLGSLARDNNGNNNALSLGSNGVTFGFGDLFYIEDRGTLECNNLKAGAEGSGFISNVGGIYQFTSATPSISNFNNSSIILSNGTISYRSVSAAPVFTTNQLTNITFYGHNSLMLSSATNAILDIYTFTNGLGPTNYFNLTMVDSKTKWQATNTTFGAGSVWLVTNTAAATFGTISNFGTLQIATSTLSNATRLVVSGTGQGGAGVVQNIAGTNLLDGVIELSGDSTIGSYLDKLTLSQAFTNNGFQVMFTNAGSSTLVASGLISGSGGLVHSGTGTLSLTSSNSFSGAVTNISGTLSIDHAFALSGLSSLVASGGTLLYNVNSTNTSANVILNGGVIEEVDTSVSLGTLTVSGNSSMTLKTGGAAGLFRFASATNTVGAGATLTIYGWSYNSATDSGSDDLIFFTNSAFETASFLNNVTFFGLGPGARILSSGELVPLTPEPGTLFIGWILSCLFGFRLRNSKRS